MRKSTLLLPAGIRATSRWVRRRSMGARRSVMRDFTLPSVAGVRFAAVGAIVSARAEAGDA